MLSARESSVESTPPDRAISSGKASLFTVHIQSGCFSPDVSNFIHASVSVTQNFPCNLFQQQGQSIVEAYIKANKEEKQ